MNEFVMQASLTWVECVSNIITSATIIEWETTYFEGNTFEIVGTLTHLRLSLVSPVLQFEIARAIRF